MEMKRCPNCGKVDTTGYGFCIKCGTEFTKEHPAQTVYIADKYVKKVTGNKLNNSSNKQIPNNQTDFNRYSQTNYPKKYTLLIVLGYILAIFGNFLGFIIIAYLLTRKDEIAMKHGIIQLAILTFYLAIIIAMFANGTLDMNTLTQMSQMEYQNMTKMMKL